MPLMILPLSDGGAPVDGHARLTVVSISLNKRTVDPRAVVACPDAHGVRMSALFELFPALRARVPWVSLGVLPTRVDDAGAVLSGAGLSGELWLKRDDLSSAIYGGNKLRLLEHLLGEARARNVARVYSSGAVGSNFAVATALHAPRVGLEPGAICFPEPLTPEGEQGHRVVCARARVVPIAHWSLLPVAAERARRQDEHEGRPSLVLSQVSLSAESLFGYVAAGLELAQQIAQKQCPAVSRLVLPIGSAATSAGILAGLSLGLKLGLNGVVSVEAVRVAAWPLSRRARVVSLAVKALTRLAELTGDASLQLGRRELLPITVATDQLGRGYPYPTPAAAAAQSAFAAAGFAILDGTYAGKAAAHLLATVARDRGPVLLWCTKSSVPLPEPEPPSSV
jgi:1-aminocyclopropane-1-carboxylate deaminase/D-cysteine desulfhydrase-like pyridoxal-dependent ACC family enzyme